MALDLDTGARREVVRVPEGQHVVDIALSPDGGTLAFSTWGAGVSTRLARVGVDGGEYRELVGNLRPEAFAEDHLWWSRDGQFVLLALPDGSGHDRLMRVPADGGEPERMRLQFAQPDRLRDARHDGRHGDPDANVGDLGDRESSVGAEWEALT